MIVKLYIRSFRHVSSNPNLARWKLIESRVTAQFLSVAMHFEQPKLKPRIEIGRSK
jgi:hypothetical protein